MIDIENMTITCSVCGRTEKIDILKSPNFSFVLTESGNRYETIKRDDVCETCLLKEDGIENWVKNRK